MRRIIFLICAMLLASPSVAATWVKLSENKNSTLQIDKQSVLQKDQLTRAWVKIDYKTPQVNIDTADKEYNLSKLLWYFDCSAQKSATSQVFQYLNTEMVYSAAIDIKAAEFIEPVPESELDLAMRYACTGRKSAKTEVASNTATKPKTEVKKATADKKSTEKSTETEKPATEAKPEVKPEAKPESITDLAKSEAVKSEQMAAEPTKEKPVKTDPHAVHWAYEGKEGPAYWAKLSAEFATCEAGKNQSPINVDATVDAPLKVLKGIQKVPAKDIINNGHTVQVNFRSGNMLLLDDVAYQMKQVHFHAPSENTIKGKAFPLEAHFVHADKNGNLAVIGVMFKEGAPNAGLEKLWGQMPKIMNVQIPLKAKITPSEMMPDNRDYYRFSGSLTTPPCSEGVRWILLKTPMTALKRAN